MTEILKKKELFDRASAGDVDAIIAWEHANVYPDINPDDVYAVQAEDRARSVELTDDEIRMIQHFANHKPALLLEDVEPNEIFGIAASLANELGVNDEDTITVIAAHLFNATPVFDY